MFYLLCEQNGMKKWELVDGKDAMQLRVCELMAELGCGASDIMVFPCEHELDSEEFQCYTSANTTECYDEIEAEVASKLTLSAPEDTKEVTTQCLNGTLKVGDLVMNTVLDDYPIMFGKVLAINLKGSEEAMDEADNDTDNVHVEFLIDDLAENYIAEICEEFSDLYGCAKLVEDLAIDDVIESPDVLICINDISDMQRARLLISQSAAESVAFEVISEYATTLRDLQHNYMLLGRMQQDCEYFLGCSNGCEKHLWAGNVEEQIAYMKNLWNEFPEDKKPEWLSFEKILDYEKQMTEQKQL